MHQVARVGDPVAHTYSMEGLLSGLAIGSLLGVAIAGTGGLAGVAIVGSFASALAGIGEVIGSLSHFTKVTETILNGSPNVFINGKPVALASISNVSCKKHSVNPQFIAEGSSSVFVNGFPVAIKGGLTTCGSKINHGSSNVFIGEDITQIEKITPEVSKWINFALAGIGISCASVLYSPVLIISGFIGSITLGIGGNWLGNKIFSEDSDGKK